MILPIFWSRATIDGVNYYFIIVEWLKC
jgi:hypothetical protein